MFIGKQRNRNNASAVGRGAMRKFGGHLRLRPAILRRGSVIIKGWFLTTVLFTYTVLSNVVSVRGTNLVLNGGLVGISGARRMHIGHTYPLQLPESMAPKGALRPQHARFPNTRHIQLQMQTPTCRPLHAECPTHHHRRSDGNQYRAHQRELHQVDRDQTRTGGRSTTRRAIRRCVASTAPTSSGS